MTFKRLLGIAMSLCAVAVLVGSVGAGATRTPAKRAIDLSTNSAVRDYLRSHGISPRHVVIQRGAKNYAGPRCPGKGWTCAKATHTVVQVASRGGKNTFACASSSCAVVQLAAAQAAPNIAKCIKTTGVTQSCSINQTSATADNWAIVYTNVLKTTGLTQDASQIANIVQQATGGPAVHNNNRACVTQYMRVDTSTVAKRGMPVLATLDGHQTLNVKQDSSYGNNNASESATPDSGGSCGTGMLGQQQIIKQTATGSARIEQDENTHDQGPNLLLDIEQNKNGGGLGLNNTNNAVFLQDNSLTAIAKTPVGPVVQTQATENGGLTAKVNQFAHGLSTADAHQHEVQCAHATETGQLDCVTGGTVSYDLTQTQHGPVHKAPGDSSQTGNSGDSFTVTQLSQQDNDTFSGQTNDISGGFHTDGTGTVTQTAIIDGQKSTDTQGGSGDVSGSITCTGSSCTSTPPRTANVLIAGTGDVIGNTEPNDNLAQALTNAGYSVTESPSLPEDLSSFSQVWWVDFQPPTSAEQNQLIAFEQSGKGVYLTGERPCCEDLNAADQSIVNAVVNGGGVTVGGQGDVCGCNDPLPVNPTVVGNLAMTPHTVTSWRPAAPGGMAGVPDSSIFSYYQPGDPSTRQVVAAAWDRASTVGSGRLVVFMDINWPEAAWRAPNWSDVAENVAYFLSGLTSPPSPPILEAQDTMVPAGPSLSGAHAQAVPARATTPTASGGVTSTTK